MSNKPTRSDEGWLLDCLATYEWLVEHFGSASAQQSGRMRLLGWDVEFVSGFALANFVDQILVRRLNDFHADTPAPRIIDCGANIGLGTLHYKREYPKARVVAFEPDPQFVPVLRRNLERNGAADVELVEAAAWIENGQVRWLCEGVDGSKILDEASTSPNVVSVRTVDLAEFLTEPVDLLKVDIEGAEYALIRHLGPRLRSVKNILVECHLNQSTFPALGELLNVLIAAGFEVSLNSFGSWRDLVRQPLVGGDHWEQYLTVAGWRSPIRAASRADTITPYAGAAHELGLRRGSDVSGGLADARARLLKSMSAEPGLSSGPDAVRTTLLDSVALRLRGGNRGMATRRLRAPFVKQGELGWAASLPQLAAGSDHQESARRSQVLLFEDSQLIGPPHAEHDDIRTLGRGRYSHWNDFLYFSTSDGSDPNSNGREYTIVYPKAIWRLRR